MLSDPPGALASATGPRGAPTGYVLVRPGARRWHVGPLVARHAADAEALLDAALGPLAGQPVVLDVPRPNLAACRLVEARGFAIVRSFSRMLRGDPPTVDLGTLFATGGPELG